MLHRVIVDFFLEVLAHLLEGILVFMAILDVLGATYVLGSRLLGALDSDLAQVDFRQVGLHKPVLSFLFFDAVPFNSFLCLSKR